MNIYDLTVALGTIGQVDLEMLRGILETHQNIIILGNGGSNAVASHIAQDYTKMLGKQALAFSDSSRMSCYANDYGWDWAYTKFIEHFAVPDTLVILISSSGNSKNMLNAAKYCRNNKLDMITMSGFDSANPLRYEYGYESLLHFYVPSEDYGIVETVHQAFLHSVI